MIYEDRWWPCFVATLGDGLLVLLITIIGWIVFRDRNWYRAPGISGFILMATSGFMIAISVEKLALAAQKWSYTEAMPIVPGIEVGAVPLLQMMMLPLLVFRVFNAVQIGR